MSGSLREKILGASDIKKELKRIDAWDVTVEVRTLTGAQRAAIKQGSTRVEKNEDGEDVQVTDEGKLYAAIMIEAVFDPTTQQKVFQIADRDAIAGKSAAALDEVVAVAMRLSGLGPVAQKAIEKNSEATPSVATTSA